MVFDGRLSNLANEWVSTEEETLLENAVLVGVPSQGMDNVQFWGKLNGTEADYLIVVAQNKLQEEQDYPDQSFFYCTNKTFKLRPLTVDRQRPAQVARSTPFTGNPKTELVPASEEGEEPAYLEVDHLGAVVSEIHSNTAVVPKGAFIADPCHKVVRNSNFSGLSVAEAGDIESYFHFRKAADPVRVRTQDGLIKPTDFLDSISLTHPPGAWSVQMDPCKKNVLIRSLLYPGYTFYHEPSTKNFAGVYIGDGSKNDDIAFML